MRFAVIDRTTFRFVRAFEATVIDWNDSDGILVAGAPDEVGPKWRYVDGEWVEDGAASVAAMPDISDRQFARGLWGDGLIGYGDFLGFVGPGVIPAAIQAVVSTLPDDDTGRPTPRKEAVGFLTGAKSYSFTHPLVEAFRAAMAASDPRWTPEYLRARWLSWAVL
ncbi:hypothetical protein [Methylobacterium aquaticum]|uniref:hypothetical protein n=1 Tax=Methylobacterium aquaticum TaxID=270351 RepID=UPI0019313F62|nr:hypothetical protein [Methylobacterium aquaticum]QRE74368.1 hypothetical protein F1D61_12805 [Methylobacterium aquaticum]